MRTLYLDCGMGAAGDMLMGALLELLPEPEVFLTKMRELDLPGIEISAKKSQKCGISGTHMEVLCHGQEDGHEQEHEHHHHHHTTLADISHILSHLNVSDRVRQDAQAVYAAIADAESRVHGTTVDQIHFHEVGTLDALADVVGVCLLMEMLQAEQVIASPVHVGSGQVRCAHGILPVPAPATAILLRGVPIYGGHIAGELCTPTGAALLTQFAARFGDMPPMRVERIGYGIGRKDFSAANCVRALLGETEDSAEDVLELACNLDDMTPEAIGFALERLLEAGALDAWTTPIGMKKSRPGVLLRALCRPEKRQAVLDVFLRDTTTLGVREHRCSRTALQRSVSETDSPWGPVRCKQAGGYGVSRKKYEFDDLARIARETGLSLPELLEKLP